MKPCWQELVGNMNALWDGIAKNDALSLKMYCQSGNKKDIIYLKHLGANLAVWAVHRAHKQVNDFPFALWWILFPFFGNSPNNLFHTFKFYWNLVSAKIRLSQQNVFFLNTIYLDYIFQYLNCFHFSASENTETCCECL